MESLDKHESGASVFIFFFLVKSSESLVSRDSVTVVNLPSELKSVFFTTCMFYRDRFNEREQVRHGFSYLLPFAWVVSLFFFLFVSLLVYQSVGLSICLSLSLLSFCPPFSLSVCIFVYPCLSTYVCLSVSLDTIFPGKIMPIKVLNNQGVMINSLGIDPGPFDRQRTGGFRAGSLFPEADSFEDRHTLFLR